MNALTEPQECPNRPVEITKKERIFSDAILLAFDGVAQSSPVPGFLIDRDHRVVSWNPAIEKLTGITRGEMVGTVPDWTSLYGRDRPCLSDILVDGRSGELSKDGPVRSETGVPCDAAETTIFLPHRRTAGTWLHVTSCIIRSPGGSVIGAMESLEDITGRMRASRDLSLAQRKLKLMGDIAWHEIQNKITGIRGYVELSRDAIRDETGRNCIDAEEQVLRQIHELLQCTREYNEIGKPHRWIPVGETVSRIVSLMERDGICVSLNVDNLELFADPALGKMFSCLIENSVKTAPHGVKISLSCAEKADSLELIYEDNGEGIPASRKKNLFPAAMVKYEFFSMTFVHDVLEFSGMAIEENGEPGHGTRFVISVPKDRYRLA